MPSFWMDGLFLLILPNPGSLGHLHSLNLRPLNLVSEQTRQLVGVDDYLQNIRHLIAFGHFFQLHMVEFDVCSSSKGTIGKIYETAPSREPQNCQKEGIFCYTYGFGFRKVFTDLRFIIHILILNFLYVFCFSFYI